ncbi:hypothetical protein ACFFX0_13850 [Citricoccus parietis]|uniref:Uncharacterized protein n=1 Tax=Citricoccus parietis TaxID=592307 RepID=A0ABV5FZW0_9MICC
MTSRRSGGLVILPLPQGGGQFLRLAVERHRPTPQEEVGGLAGPPAGVAHPALGLLAGARAVHGEPGQVQGQEGPDQGVAPAGQDIRTDAGHIRHRLGVQGGQGLHQLLPCLVRLSPRPVQGPERGRLHGAQDPVRGGVHAFRGVDGEGLQAIHLTRLRQGPRVQADRGEPGGGPPHPGGLDELELSRGLRVVAREGGAHGAGEGHGAVHHLTGGAGVVHRSLEQLAARLLFATGQRHQRRRGIGGADTGIDRLHQGAVHGLRGMLQRTVPGSLVEGQLTQGGLQEHPLLAGDLGVLGRGIEDPGGGGHVPLGAEARADHRGDHAPHGFGPRDGTQVLQQGGHLLGELAHAAAVAMPQAGPEGEQGLHGARLTDLAQGPGVLAGSVLEPVAHRHQLRQQGIDGAAHGAEPRGGVGGPSRGGQGMAEQEQAGPPRIVLRQLEALPNLVHRPLQVLRGEQIPGARRAPWPSLGQPGQDIPQLEHQVRPAGQHGGAQRQGQGDRIPGQPQGLMEVAEGPHPVSAAQGLSSVLHQRPDDQRGLRRLRIQPLCLDPVTQGHGPVQDRGEDPVQFRTTPGRQLGRHERGQVRMGQGHRARGMRDAYLVGVQQAMIRQTRVTQFHQRAAQVHDVEWLAGHRQQAEGVPQMGRDRLQRGLQGTAEQALGRILTRAQSRHGILQPAVSRRGVVQPPGHRAHQQGDPARAAVDLAGEVLGHGDAQPLPQDLPAVRDSQGAQLQVRAVAP